MKNAKVRGDKLRSNSHRRWRIVENAKVRGDELWSDSHRRWRIVVNSMQARALRSNVRAQLGERQEQEGERRRRSVVVAASQIPQPTLSEAHTLFCAITTINRYKRLQASTRFLLHSPFFMVFRCFRLWHVLVQTAINALGICQKNRPIGMQ